MPLFHFVYIPLVLVVGGLIGWMVRGAVDESRAADKADAAARKDARSAAHDA